MEFSKCTNRRKEITAPSPNLAVNPARKSRRLRVQPNSSSTHVQAFSAVSGVHTRRIQSNGFSVGKDPLRGTDRIQRQSQRRGQIVSSPGRQDSNRNVCAPSHRVQEGLKRAIASQRKDAFPPPGGFIPCDLRKFRGTLCAAKFRAPLIFRRKRPQARESF